jgi:hypothetical protein
LRGSHDRHAPRDAAGQDACSNLATEIAAELSELSLMTVDAILNDLRFGLCVKSFGTDAFARLAPCWPTLSSARSSRPETARCGVEFQSPRTVRFMFDDNRPHLRETAGLRPHQMLCICSTNRAPVSYRQ